VVRDFGGGRAPAVCRKSLILYQNTALAVSKGDSFQSPLQGPVAELGLSQLYASAVEELFDETPMSSRRVDRGLQLFGLCFVLTQLALAADSLPAIAANENHVPAGTLHDGVLTVQLEIAKGEWHPESDDGITLSVYAFGEAGQPLQNPGPLLRVPQGTEIHASLHNTLTVPITVHGLGDSAGGVDAVVHLAPGVTQQVKIQSRHSRAVPVLGRVRSRRSEVALRHRLGVDWGVRSRPSECEHGR
jgi:hypothetical protein